MTKQRRIEARMPLTAEELEHLRADDFVRLKLTEDEKSRLREINKARERERTERTARLRIEQEPLLAELRAIGWDVKSVWDLVNTSARYAEAIPILLKHLSRPYSDIVRGGIARALAVPDARFAWPVLAAEYRKESGDEKRSGLGAKDGLAVALSATVTKSAMGELISLAKDRAHGTSRVLLLPALRRSKDPLAKQALEDLANDPDLEKQIARYRKKSR